VGDGRFSLVIDLALDDTPFDTSNGGINRTCRVLHHPMNEGQVFTVDLLPIELVCHIVMGILVFRNQEETGGVPVKTMNGAKKVVVPLPA
jgi:isopenicillin N synthase-like dioxygenase